MIITNLNVKYITTDNINYCSKLTQYTVKKTHNNNSYQARSDTISQGTFNRNNIIDRDNKYKSIMNYKNR